MKIIISVILGLLLLISDADAARKKQEEPKPDIGKEIQIGVMSFSDTWAAALGQTTMSMAAKAETPQQELELYRFRYLSLMAAYDIAAHPYPGISMLDMMVLASLTRVTWEGYWLKHYGESAETVHRALQELEQTIWDFGSVYLSSAQTDALRDLVEEWSAAHPNAKGASFVRFSDFGGLSRKPALQTAVKKGGLLSPVRDAAQSAEEIKELGERAIFLSIRMQELMMGRLELMTRQTLQAKELQQLFDDINGFRNVAEQYARIMEGMPQEVEGVVTYTIDEISRERVAALEQMLEGISVERAAAVDQVLTAVSMERQATLEQTLDGLKEERIGIIKAVGHIIFWLELEMRALVIRLFIAFSGIIISWFGLRLIYRYWVDRVANNFLKVLGVAILFVVITMPILLIGMYLIVKAEPDLSQQATFTDEMMSRIEQVHQ